MSTTLKGIVIGAFGMLLLLVVIGLFVILTGSYNVAATQRHTPIGGWALNTNFTNSVQGQASGIEAPADFTQAMISAGGAEYKAMCQHCHGGVGAKRAEWAEGMRPKPPALAHAAQSWSAAEVFWLVKHGAKMTGMPAFGPTHNDDALWNIAAFVKAMPQMSAAEYAGYEAEHSGSGKDSHAHEEQTAPHHD